MIMNMISRNFVIFSLIFFFAAMALTGFGQGVIVNEISNGSGGTEEYMELVVVGPPANPNCGPIDIRGWIIDDNNGDFSCGSCAGTGIAGGHIRFSTTNPVWAAVPTGSIIVVYDNSGLKNPMIAADDPDDLGSPDGVYILPVSHALLDVSIGGACTNIPFGSNSCGSCSGNDTYPGACYTTGGANSNCGMRNSGDAAQTRLPGGAYFHGIGYGTAASLITGGPDNLFISGSGTGRYYTFDNSVSDDFRDGNNFSFGLVSGGGETPGAGNTALNTAWITGLQAPCLLPLPNLLTLKGRTEESKLILDWEMLNTEDIATFEVELSGPGFPGFTKVGELKAESQQHSYSFEQSVNNQGLYLLKISQINYDGTSYESQIIELSLSNESQVTVYPNPFEGKTRFVSSNNSEGTVSVYDLNGKLISAYLLSSENNYSAEFDASGLTPGIYSYLFKSGVTIKTGKLLKI